MKNMFKYLFVFLVFSSLFLNFAQAQAVGRSRGTAPSPKFSSGRSGVLLDFAVFYGQDEATANPNVGNEYKDNDSVYDIKLGYVFNNDFYFGGDLSVRNYSYLGGTSTGQSTGAGFGYFFSNNFNVRAFYRFNESYDNYRDGSGFQADLNYLLNLSSNFYLGFLISHRQTTFTTNSQIASFEKWTYKTTFPAISFGFLIN